MRLVRLWPVVAVALSVLLVPVPTHACTCIAGIPICETFWKTDVVFAGEALDITPGPREVRDGVPKLLSGRRVRFRVERVWRGTADDTIEVITGAGGGDCGYAFRRGERYLVFAHQSDGALRTSICSPTKPLARAQEELAFLNQPVSPAAGGRILGTVTRRLQPSGPDQPAANYVVSVRNDAREWKATTDAHGRYELTGMPEGKYRIHLIVPPVEHAYGRPEIELADARGCAGVDFVVVPDGRVSVRILDHEGKPLPRVRVQLVEADSLSNPVGSSRGSIANDQGEAEFILLPPGRYLLGVNITDAPEAGRPYARVFHPGVTHPHEATSIDLGPGERVQLGSFRLSPPLEARTVIGRLAWPDGRPAAGVPVYLSASSGVTSGSRTQTDADGQFEFAVYEGVTYRVSAYIDIPGPDRRQWSARSGDILITGDAKPVQLVLQPPRR